MATYKELESAILIEARKFGGFDEMDFEDAYQLIVEVAEQCGAYHDGEDLVYYYANYNGEPRLIEVSSFDFACFFLR
jgi:hypothetical protein